MTPTQRLFAITTSVAALVLAVELVRRRKVREEYSLLWLFSAAAMMVLSARYDLLEALTRLIGAVTVTTTLFIFALLFLFAVCVHFSVVISRLTGQVRRLTQELALVTADRAATPRPDRPRVG